MMVLNDLKSNDVVSLDRSADLSKVASREPRDSNESDHSNRGDDVYSFIGFFELGGSFEDFGFDL
jgi:hypothetical protein